MSLTLYKQTINIPNEISTIIYYSSSCLSVSACMIHIYMYNDNVCDNGKNSQFHAQT